ncbi:hypothetical protein VA7868_01060 [Vibrio aerogenes CECT 7868]|uniref:DUF4865 domain-containing protein n=1 Tax=Vibrio aerogenes CECT 7868 TaxID=1216006 RepID=A0A1M5XA65_9VIBR|nr:DUF4865 family protein [Vibrio aerogenes]SHH96720.1 hypothetical protein VA7868_01060 [Vibrio aerogenes CECT 7868]
MIAMQYKIILPADYPMEQIESRIRDKGHLLNDYPGLFFKAYLYSRKDSETYPAKVNSYAPFYVWRNHEAMQSFLESEGFKALCDQFARPAVNIWYTEGHVTMPLAHHCAAHISCRSARHDVQGTDFFQWKTIGADWLTGEEPEEHTDTGEVYQIGYIAYSDL